MPDISDNTNWFETDASNNKASPNGWPEGMMPSGVNDSARANMGALKRFWDRINPVQVVTPSGGVWTFTTANPAYPAAYVDGEVYTFGAGGPSVGGDSFQVNTLGAKPIQKIVYGGFVAIAAQDILGGTHPQLIYKSGLAAGAGGFLLVNRWVPAQQDGAGGISVPGNLVVGGNATVSGGITVAGGITAAGNLAIGSYLYFSGATGSVNGAGGPLIFADGNTMVFKEGSGANGYWFQNYAGANVATISAAGALTVQGAINGLQLVSNGITYPSTEGHVIAFGWNGANVVAHVDGTATPGALATVSNLAGYLPLSGGTISGPLSVNANAAVAGTLVVGGSGAAAINVPSGGVNAVSVTVSGLQLSNDGTNALYTPNKIRGAGLQSDGTLLVGGGATIGGALTVNGTPLACQNVDAANDINARGVFRWFPNGGGSKGARIELCSGSSWDFVQFSVVGGGPGGAELYISPDANSSGFIIFADTGFSDARLKKNIRDSEVDALAAILATPVRAFDWNEEGEGRMPNVGSVSVGLVADEVEKTMPFVVRTTSRDDMRRIIDQRLTPYLFRAIQQLAERLETLEAK
jgi:hypothetical protein